MKQVRLVGVTSGVSNWLLSAVKSCLQGSDWPRGTIDFSKIHCDWPMVCTHYIAVTSKEIILYIEKLYINFENKSL